MFYPSMNLTKVSRSVAILIEQVPWRQITRPNFSAAAAPVRLLRLNLLIRTKSPSNSSRASGERTAAAAEASTWEAAAAEEIVVAAIAQMVNGQPPIVRPLATHPSAAVLEELERTRKRAYDELSHYRQSNRGAHNGSSGYFQPKSLV